MTASTRVALIPRKTFFENPVALNPALSCDGSSIAWLAPFEGVMNVWVAPRDDLASARVLTRVSDRPIPGHFFARTNAHILYLRDKGGNENFHLWCVPIDGSEAQDLTPYGDVKVIPIKFHRDNPFLVAVGINDRDPRWHDLYVLDIRTGERRLLHENTEEVAEYLLDGELGLRLASSARGKGSGRAILKWNGTTFVEIRTIPAEDALATFLWHINRAGDAWYMSSAAGRDRSVLLRVDWATNAETMIAAHDKADIAGGMVDPRSDDVTAVHADYIRNEWIPLDPQTGRDLAALEERLGADVALVSQTDDGMLWIVSAGRPDLPAAWHLYDRRSGEIRFLMSARPGLERVTLAPMQGLVLKARDGLDLVSYLTLPAGLRGPRPPAPLPMVLYVHGGPWSRDRWAYNRQTQWYADRGYAVLQVNYRGSVGFGKAFTNAGDKEWAGRMHDDLIDAVDWAVAEGIADRERVAICGASYGGYAAFVGATFTPDVFRCSVPVVGISNLETLLADPPPYWASFYEQECLRIGDPRTEEGRALLRERSPLHRAAAIRKPMLIGHGANDVRCKVAESDQIVAAMTAHGIPVTYVVYPDEGHGFARPENNIAFNAISEAFLARHLGGACEPIGDDFRGSNHEIRSGADILTTIEPASAA